MNVFCHLESVVELIRPQKVMQNLMKIRDGRYITLYMYIMNNNNVLLCRMIK